MEEFNINDLTNCFKMSVDMQGIKRLEEYISNLVQENEELKIQNRKLESNWNKVKADLELLAEYGDGDDASEWDKRYGEFAKNHLRYIKELEGKSE